MYSTFTRYMYNHNLKKLFINYNYINGVTTQVEIKPKHLRNNNGPVIKFLQIARI